MHISLTTTKPQRYIIEHNVKIVRVKLAIQQTEREFAITAVRTNCVLDNKSDTFIMAVNFEAVVDALSMSYRPRSFFCKRAGLIHCSKQQCTLWVTQSFYSNYFLMYVRECTRCVLLRQFYLQIYTYNNKYKRLFWEFTLPKAL